MLPSGTLFFAVELFLLELFSYGSSSRFVGIQKGVLMSTTLLIVLVTAAVLAAVVAGIYNRLVELRNRYKNAYSQIDVQLKRRYDLIPNLVETAKGYLKHERDTLEAVIAARNQATAAAGKAAANPGNPEAMRSLSGAESGLTGALGRLFALAEAYPDLKANQNMMSLQEELSSTENKVAFARQAYNDAVTDYNTGRESFPNVLVAGPLGFGNAELLVIQDEKERARPDVKF